GNNRYEGADHVDLAMSEIDHADDAVHHRVADRDQPIDRPQGQTVDELLQKICHPPADSRPRSMERYAQRFICRKPPGTSYVKIETPRSAMPDDTVSAHRSPPSVESRFDWADPLRLDAALSGEERMARDSAPA